jgi:hypothetical protein
MYLPDDLAVIFVLHADARNVRSGLADLLRREFEDRP